MRKGFVCAEQRFEGVRGLPSRSIHEPHGRRQRLHPMQHRKVDKQRVRPHRVYSLLYMEYPGETQIYYQFGDRMSRPNAMRAKRGVLLLSGRAWKCHL